MTTLCSGATGMVGTALLRELLEHTDQTIRAPVHRTAPHLLDPRVEYHPADLASLESCRELARGCELAVLAAAATAGAAANQGTPEAFVTQNLLMNAQLLQALAEAGTRRVVLVGSASVYPERAEPWSEADLDLNVDPPPPFFGVGWVMRALEKLARFWHQCKGLEVAVVRLSNVYGPCARFHPGTSNFIPALIRRAVDRQDPFEVWGSPDVSRDVLYAADCARALRLLLEKPDLDWRVLNLAAGVSVSVGEVVEEVLRAAEHRPGRVDWLGQAPVTVSRRAYRIDALAETLGWRPEIGLQEGLARTVAWWREHRHNWLR